jgi:hypothetical protein
MNEKDEEIVENINKIENKGLLPTVTNQIVYNDNNSISLKSMISDDSFGSDSSPRTRSFLTMEDAVSKMMEIKNKFNSLIIKKNFII